MNIQEVESFIQKVPALKCLVIGDLILDQYVWGSAERISPEAPVPVVSIEKKENRLGGAGNVVNNLRELGCAVRLVSVVGDDADGQILNLLLKQRNVLVDDLVVAAGRVSTCKTRVIASHQQMLRFDQEECRPILPLQEDLLLNHVCCAIAESDIVLISDYLKGVLTDRVLTEIFRLADTNGCRTIVDPKSSDFSCYRGATLLTPNRKEAEIASGIKIDSHENLLNAGRLLKNMTTSLNLLITRGAEGMSLFEGDSVTHLPTKGRDVYDVSGAGDTVVAFCAAGMAAGFSLADSARLANLAAGIVVGKLGTSTVSPDDLLISVLAENRENSAGIVSQERLMGLLNSYRKTGTKIVFTNGCFDLLHAGHVKYLQRARNLGDILVLGLNSDESIRRLKGAKRPLLKQAERAQILAALDSVDYVTIFEEDTPENLIRLVHPDILAKGGDYSATEVVGREFVESYGGRLELIEFENGKSTTNIIDEVLTRYRDK